MSNSYDHSDSYLIARHQLMQPIATILAEVARCYVVQ